MRGPLLVVLLGLSAVGVAIAACVATPDVSGLPPYDAGTVVIVDGNITVVDSATPIDAGTDAHDAAPDVVTEQDTGTDAPVNNGCGPLDLGTAPVVTATSVKAPAPPMDGGAIQSGFYQWTATTVFSDAGTVPLPPPTRGVVQYVDGGRIDDSVTFLDGGPEAGIEAILANDISLDGGVLTWSASARCNAVGVGTERYTSTPTGELYIAHPVTGGTIVDTYGIQ
jgi:hypothetical protein